MSARIRVAEIFGPTIQGEGALIGRPTVFVRTGGCDYRCSWCDSLHAVESEYRHEWAPLGPEEILQTVERLSENRPTLITLSGGNPAIQPLGDLIRIGGKRGHRFALETQATLAPDWLRDLDTLVLSPKPPSSGMTWETQELQPCLDAAQGRPEIVLKFVVFDEADYRFARETARAYPDLPVCLQPGNHTPPPPDDADAPIDLEGVAARMTWLVARALEDDWPDVRVLPQLHVMLWGNKRGV